MRLITCPRFAEKLIEQIVHDEILVGGTTRILPCWILFTILEDLLNKTWHAPLSGRRSSSCTLCRMPTISVRIFCHDISAYNAKSRVMSYRHPRNGLLLPAFTAISGTFPSIFARVSVLSPLTCPHLVLEVLVNDKEKICSIWPK